jgi:hypothetical protein
MNTLFVGDNAVLQTGQDGASFVVMGANATVVSVGSDVIFAGAGHSTIYDTGIQAASGTYQGDTVVLGAGTATVLIGSINSTVYGGSGTADIFYNITPGTLVTGSGNLNIIGNPNGLGIFWGGGITSMTHDSSGTTVHTGLGATAHLFAAGSVS